MVAFIDDHRGAYGVEPICRGPPIAPSTYYPHHARTAEPVLRSETAKRDESLAVELQRVWQVNRSVYGPRKVGRQLGREGQAVARCTVERLRRVAGLRGVMRGRRVRTTMPDTATEPPRALVQRAFAAERPKQLWVAAFTYVATWRGMVYATFVVDAFSRRIVGWRASGAMCTDLARCALEQALHDRATDRGLVPHRDWGSQYLAIHYTERLAEAGIEASVGRRGDAYDNAMAESVIGLFKTEVIRHAGPWQGINAVELATLKWVWWFHHHRLLEPLGYLSPAESEAQYTLTQAAPVAA